MIDALISDIRNAGKLAAAAHFRRGNEIVLPADGDVFITGDLHGDVDSFERIVALADLTHNPRRHLILQELVHGRDSEPGECGSCVLTEKVARLITRFPRRVHLLLGNHEMAELTGRVIMKEGVVLNKLFEELVKARYDGHGEEALSTLHGLWRSLPLAARTPNRVFISHSTPSAQQLAGFTPEILRRPLVDADFARSGAAYALCWGRDFAPETAERVAASLDADFLVVGHTPCTEGYQTPNRRHIILDSQGSSGKYLLAPLAGSLTYDELVGRIRPIWRDR